MTAFVSLFRGINVGGQHKVRMAELKELHESLGLKDVFTYIQSGNVVFSSGEEGEEGEEGEADVEDVERLRRQIEDGFEQKFGFHSDVFVRSSAELEEIIENNPFHNQPDKAPNWIVVMFLGARPEEAAQKDLLETYVGPEELFVIGKELHVYYTNGIGRSKLMPGLLEKKLKTVGTARNWNTVLKLQELMQR